MYQEKNIAIDHGNRNMKTENLIFTLYDVVRSKNNILPFFFCFVV